MAENQVNYTRIIIGCMDSRLNGVYRDLDDGATLFLRNAGANAYGAGETVKKLLNEHPEIERITLAPHTDCKAMGKVWEGLHMKKDGEHDFDQEVKDWLLRPYKQYNDGQKVGSLKGNKIASIQKLIELNGEIQQAMLVEMLGKTFTGKIDFLPPIRTDRIVLDKSFAHQEPEVLILCPCGAAHYETAFKEVNAVGQNIYVLQGESPSEIGRDLKMLQGVKADLHRVSVSSDNPRDAAVMAIVGDSINARKIPGINLNFEINEAPKFPKVRAAEETTKPAAIRI